MNPNRPFPPNSSKADKTIATKKRRHLSSAGRSSQPCPSRANEWYEIAQEPQRRKEETRSQKGSSIVLDQLFAIRELKPAFESQDPHTVQMQRRKHAADGMYF